MCADSPSPLLTRLSNTVSTGRQIYKHIFGKKWLIFQNFGKDNLDISVSCLLGKETAEGYKRKVKAQASCEVKDEEKIYEELKKMEVKDCLPKHWRRKNSTENQASLTLKKNRWFLRKPPPKKRTIMQHFFFSSLSWVSQMLPRIEGYPVCTMSKLGWN